MRFVRLLPALISLLLLGAHFFRAGQWVPVLAVLATLWVLPIRHSWTTRVVQGVLLIGAAEWIRTAVVLVLARQALGLPWIRLVLILGPVALLMLGSAFVIAPGRCRGTAGSRDPDRQTSPGPREAGHREAACPQHRE